MGCRKVSYDLTVLFSCASQTHHLGGEPKEEPWKPRSHFSKNVQPSKGKTACFCSVWGMTVLWTATVS